MVHSDALPEALPALPTAILEALACLALVGMTALAFLFGVVGLGVVIVVSLLVLAALTVLSWIRFDQGRHPCFLFLAVLLLFQGGRFIGYCLGDLDDPFRVDLMTLTPFGISPMQAGLISLLIVLSAVCIYLVCRWNTHPLPAPAFEPGRRYLPYLYLLFFASLPIQTFKNYAYFHYVQMNGGYSAIFVNHAALAATVPAFVRAISLISLPSFVAIFVFEQRRWLRWLVTILYFSSAAVILLLGSRMTIFSLILALWYAARIRSQGRVRLIRVAALFLALIFLANLVSVMRTSSNSLISELPGPMFFVEQQGASLEVTTVCVVERKLFSPYRLSYLLHELSSAYVAGGAYNYVRGNMFDADVSNFLNASAYRWGFGVGGTYIGEAYILGGFVGVILVSILIGLGLRLLYSASRTGIGLFIVVMMLPEILLMPRGDLLGWLSVLSRTVLSVILLAIGWFFYRLLADVLRIASVSTPVRNAG